MARSFHTYVRTCGDCGANTNVIDTREQADGTIFRTRLCSKCGYRFRTIEVEESVSNLTPLFDETRVLKKEIERLRATMKRAQEVLEIEEVL